MKLIIGILFTLISVNQAKAGSAIDPGPFITSMVCQANNQTIHVELFQLRTWGKGPAKIIIGDTNLVAGWDLVKANEYTRLAGYYFLNIKGDSIKLHGIIGYYTRVNELEHFSGGWLEMDGFSGPVNCKIGSDDTKSAKSELFSSTPECGPMPHVRYIPVCCNGHWQATECN